MVTIKDIAEATGVSCTTVSNVIHNRHHRVSDETIEKINTAIKELGYIPNMSARALVSNSSKVIGFINHMVTGKDLNFMEDSFSSVFRCVGAVIGSNTKRKRKSAKVPSDIRPMPATAAIGSLHTEACLAYLLADNLTILINLFPSGRILNTSNKKNKNGENAQNIPTPFC